MKPHTEAIRRDLVVRRARPRKNGISSTATQEVKDWLNTMTTDHWYFYECRQTMQLRIAFTNHNDAVKFKLAWH